MYPFQEPVALVCNSEGKLLGLPMNRRCWMKIACPMTSSADLFIAGWSGGLVSLTDEQLQRYKSLYDNVQILPVRTATGEQGRIVGDQHIEKKEREI